MLPMAGNAFAGMKQTVSEQVNLLHATFQRGVHGGVEFICECVDLFCGGEPSVDANSAAAVGVAARWSATKSAMVMSVS